MKLTQLSRTSDTFFDVASRIESEMQGALRIYGFSAYVDNYEDTIKSVAFAALEELIERIAEIEARENENQNGIYQSANTRQDL